MNQELTDVYGHLLEVPRVASNSGVHQSFVGRVSHGHLGEVDVHLKTLDAKRIANELVAASVAAALGVNVPPTFLVLVDNAKLQVQHRVGDKAFCLASQVIPGARDLRSAATLLSPAALAQFYEAVDWRAVVVLDALIANSDRTPANLLQDEAGRLWAIDHDTAFGGDWLPSDLVAKRHSTNLLARAGSYIPSQEMREETLRAWSVNSLDVSFSEAVRLPSDAKLLTRDETTALSLYLERRWESFAEVLHHALFNPH